LFSSKPIPPGKLVDINGTKLHIIAEGRKNDLPTLVLESGAVVTQICSIGLLKD
jgi:hypothetical protein